MEAAVEAGTVLMEASTPPAPCLAPDIGPAVQESRGCIPFALHCSIQAHGDGVGGRRQRRGQHVVLINHRRWRTAWGFACRPPTWPSCKVLTEPNTPPVPSAAPDQGPNRRREYRHERATAP